MISVRALYLRTAKYLRRHGLKALFQRLRREARNRFRYNRDIIYSRDLLRGGLDDHPLPEEYRVVEYDKSTGLPEKLIKRIGEEYSEEIVQNYVSQRLEKGACLWCLESDADHMSYSWALTGRAMKPYYFPLGERDLHLFDGYTFPPFRGRGLNVILLDHVLKRYRDLGFVRALLETHEWNVPVIKMVPKNGFVRIGLARKKIRRGKCRVTWWLDREGQ